MYLEFISQYWYLFLMLFVIVFFLSMQPMTAGAKKISALQLPQLQTRQKAVIVDVSTTPQFKQGHIAQAINLPLESLQASLKKLHKHKTKSIILTCQNGANSAKAVSILRAGEFTDLHILDGGLAAWRKENLPLTKS